MTHKSGISGWVRSALRHAQYEVLPTANVAKSIAEHVPKDVQVTVTASPSKGIEATVHLAEHLAREGYQVVPHLAARMITGREELETIVARLTSVGITNVFCPAGDADPAAGEYVGALAMLEHLTQMGRPFADVGITGYPESHPSIEDEVAVQSMWDKREHATYIVSNLCFDPATIAEWVAKIRSRGVDLPVLIGMPGPIERAKLLTMATKIGVGQSIRFLGTHVSAFARIAAPGGYNPERFLRKAGEVLADPELRIEGLHVFTFNQLGPTETWRQHLLS
jgi:methylenetetrahydrofolate reductase (NADPH)